MLLTPRFVRPACRESHGHISRTRSRTVHRRGAAPPPAVGGGDGGANGTSDRTNLGRQPWSAFTAERELARADYERKLLEAAERRKAIPSPKGAYMTSLAWAALFFPRSREEFWQAKAELDRLNEESKREIAKMHQRWEEAHPRQASRKTSDSSSVRLAPPEALPPSGPWPAASVEDDPWAAQARAAAAEASAAAAVSWTNAAVGHEAAAEAAARRAAARPASQAGAAAAEWGRAAAAWRAAFDALGAARQAAPDAAAVQEAAAAVEAARGLKSQLRSLQG
ncbi:hypothetical protein ABPG77_000069 [Micractinium sp. CCAP 211/92]